jgi:adenylyl-sulfate kinase
MKKIYWFTGLSGSGKTTIADNLKVKLDILGKRVLILDGDMVREKLHTHLGFSREDIKENNRLIAKLAKDELSNYDVILVPIISPYLDDRAMAKRLIGEHFAEIFINAPLQECIQRDVKGLYKKALAGEIDNFIGVHDSNPYQAPQNPDLELNTKILNEDECSNKLLQFIQNGQY